MRLVELDVATGSHRVTASGLPHGTGLVGVAPSGRTILARAGSVYLLIDVADGQPTPLSTPATQVLAWYGADRLATVVNDTHVVDLVTGTELFSVSAPGRIFRMDLSRL